MKKLFLFLFILLAINTFSQTSLKVGNNLLAGPFAIASISSVGDTNFPFILPKDMEAYSIVYVLTDTVETHAVGIFQKISMDGVNFIQIGDSVSVPVTTYPKAAIVATGTSFPYGQGEVTIRKDGASDGDIKLFIYVTK